MGFVILTQPKVPECASELRLRCLWLKLNILGPFLVFPKVQGGVHSCTDPRIATLRVKWLLRGCWISWSFWAILLQDIYSGLFLGGGRQWAPWEWLRQYRGGAVQRPGGGGCPLGRGSPSWLGGWRPPPIGKGWNRDRAKHDGKGKLSFGNFCRQNHI